MTRTITTCLLGVGLMAAATTFPLAQAHEGHGGHDHGGTLAAPQESPPHVRPTDSTSDLVTSPPPFETLDRNPAQLLAPPAVTPPDRTPDRRGPENRSPRQPQHGSLERFVESNPNSNYYDGPRLDSENGSYAQELNPFDRFAYEGDGLDGRGTDSFSPLEFFPSSARSNQTMSEHRSELYRGCPGNRASCTYDQNDRHCTTAARSADPTRSSCNLPDVGYQNSHLRQTEFDRSDYRQYGNAFHCPRAVGNCDNCTSQFPY